MQSPLLTAAISTFESLALLFADVPPTAAQAEAALTHVARVTFDGPYAGALEVAVSDAVADALAANMLGFSVDVVRADHALRRDAVGELANVVCGNVLPLVAGRDAVFHLAAPVVDAIDGRAASPAGDALTAVVGIEDGRAVLALHVDDPAGLPAFASAFASALASTAPAASLSLLP